MLILVASLGFLEEEFFETLIFVHFFCKIKVLWISCESVMLSLLLGLQRDSECLSCFPYVDFRLYSFFFGNMFIF